MKQHRQIKKLFTALIAACSLSFASAQWPVIKHFKGELTKNLQVNYEV